MLFKSCVAMGGIAISLLLLAGCANKGWVYYREGMTCHFRTPNENCEEKYQNAIRENDKLPGVHSSYGTHLLMKGKTDAAQVEFNKEIKNYPASKTAVLLLTSKSQPAADNVTTTLVPADTLSSSVEGNK